MSHTVAFVGLGANLGDTLHALHSAFAELQRLPLSWGHRCSSWFRSAPVDAQGPDYLNGVARLETALAPDALLSQLQHIESWHGRVRAERNAPRTLDLDLLLYGDLCLDTDELTLPHPRLHQRAFVLLPLLELEPELAVPGLGGLKAWLPSVADQRIERIT